MIGSLFMSWTKHPKFQPILKKIISGFRDKEALFFKSKPIIFLCGAANSPARDRIKAYLHKQDKFALFYADNVWEIIADHTNGNALEMEENLANISDAVVIVVESAGTFTELGAFSLNSHLRKKLIPIFKGEHKADSSFINSGPVKWINNESDFSPVIWGNFDSILDSALELDMRLNKIKSLDSSVPIKLAHSPKHLLLFLCDLIAVFSPCKLSHIKQYYKMALDQEAGELITYLIGLATSMELISKVNTQDDIYYFRLLTSGRTSFRNKKFFHIPQLRAEVISVLLSYEEGTNAMKIIENNKHAN